MDYFVIPIIGLAATYVVGTVIGVVRKSTYYPGFAPRDSKSQYITQETEDALQPSTLALLLSHYNQSIRETAARIIFDRVENNSQCLEALFAGLAHPNYDERLCSLKALSVIFDEGELVPNQSRLDQCFNTKEGVSLFGSLWLLTHYAERARKLSKPKQKLCLAIVRCLELGLCDREPPVELIDPYFDEFYLRDYAERLCLVLVSHIMKSAPCGVFHMVDAQFVEKWLARQAWGQSPEEKQENFDRYMKSKSNRLKDICKLLQQYTCGRDALSKAGLLSRARAVELAQASADDRINVIVELQVLASESAADNTGNQSSQRLSEAASAARRRQNRETMVFNDGTRPLRPGDIIRRITDS